MITTCATISQINKAIKEINIKYENNLVPSTMINVSVYEDILKLKVNLLIKDLNGKGGRIVYVNRVLPWACWHAHFDFFNKLIEINPKAIIMTGEDWIIKKDPTENKIIGNPAVKDKSRIHRIRPSSYLCNCNK